MKAKYSWKSFRIILGLLCTVLLIQTDTESAYALTRAEDARLNELVAMGYLPEVAADQVQEEFHRIDGMNGTGGLDGKWLDGSPATGIPFEYSGPNDLKPRHTHVWVETSRTKGDCVTEGEVIYKCEYCSNKKTEKLSKGEHIFELSSHLDATCVELATDTYTCTVCGDSYNEQSEGYVDHVYELQDTSTTPSCTEKGVNIYKCAVCDETYEEDVEPCGHQWSTDFSWVKDPDCTHEGLKVIHCVQCDIVKSGSETTIPAKGHVENLEHLVTSPSFWNDGREEIYCIDCGALLETIALSKTGGWKVLLPIIVVTLLLSLSILILLSMRKNKKQSTSEKV